MNLRKIDLRNEPTAHQDHLSLGGRRGYAHRLFPLALVHRRLFAALRLLRILGGHNRRIGRALPGRLHSRDGGAHFKTHTQLSLNVQDIESRKGRRTRYDDESGSRRTHGGKERWGEDKGRGAKRNAWERRGRVFLSTKRVVSRFDKADRRLGKRVLRAKTSRERGLIRRRGLSSTLP